MIRNVALAIAVLVLLGANFALAPNPSKRNYELLPDMARPVSVQSFSGADRLPVPGTVLYQSKPVNETVNPMKADAKTLARGEAVFVNFCQVCHGPAARGDGPVAQRGFPAPPSLVAPAAKSRGLTDGQIFHIITVGQNNMPSYATQIDPDDRWRAVLFVRSLQQRER